LLFFWLIQLNLIYKLKIKTINTPEAELQFL
jgi:hypothetical protein